ncbi:MAG: NAD(P)/FAD-dependent oxidoreductase [Nanoarchaeota archaeon]|nr:NAD(P)/FAD-dependent oxidoreductase [Nanoarchaeota archaeon]
MAKIGIVGAGFTGLTAGNYLAAQGHDVLILEKHDKVGGGAQSWEKAVKPLGIKYIGESIHVLSHLDPGKELRKTLEGAGVDFDQAVGEIVRPANFARAVTREGEAIMPNSDVEWEKMLLEKFPQEAKGVQAFFQNMRSINAERYVDTNPGWKKSLLEWTAGMPSYLSFVNAAAQGLCRRGLAAGFLFTPTWDKVLNKYFSSTELKAHFQLLNGYVGLSSEECASNLMKVALAFYTIDGGAQMPKYGSFQKIPEEMARVLERKGGKVFTHTGIEDLIIAEGKVKTLIVKAEKSANGLSKGNTYQFDVDEVIWTADPITLVRYAEKQLPSSYIQKIRRLEKSTSLTGFHAIVDSHLEEFRDLFDVASLVVAETFADIDDPQKELYLTAPTLHREGLIYDFAGNPVEGKHVLNFYVQDRDRDGWIKGRKESGGNKGDYNQEKIKFMQEKIRFIDDILGTDLQHRILHLDPLTAATVARYMNNQGEVYGVKSTPQQFVPNNLSKYTPLQNVILASHYTFGAGGVPGALTEGKDAARILLEKLG